jgi:hypothetical protein
VGFRTRCLGKVAGIVRQNLLRSGVGERGGQRDFAPVRTFLNVGKDSTPVESWALAALVNVSKEDPEAGCG